ncbi:MAG TPA: hypothetical protein DEX20_03885 [Halieaceae bacterium]|nr:hypothetical protein [Halieaceae bacterium]
MPRLREFHANRITLSKGFPDTLRGGDLFLFSFSAPKIQIGDPPFLRVRNNRNLMGFQAIFPQMVL